MESNFEIVASTTQSILVWIAGHRAHVNGELGQAEIGQRIAAAIDRATQSEVAELRAKVAELERLLAFQSESHATNLADHVRWRTDAESKLADLERTFPCGHRIIDWDDSYGGCLACGLKVAAVECDTERHDERIAEAEAKVRKAIEGVSVAIKRCHPEYAPHCVVCLPLRVLLAALQSPEPVNHPEPATSGTEDTFANAITARHDTIMKRHFNHPEPERIKCSAIRKDGVCDSVMNFGNGIGGAIFRCQMRADHDSRHKSVRIVQGSRFVAVYWRSATDEELDRSEDFNHPDDAPPVESAESAVRGFKAQVDLALTDIADGAARMEALKRRVEAKLRSAQPRQWKVGDEAYTRQPFFGLKPGRVRVRLMAQEGNHPSWIVSAVDRMTFGGWAVMESELEPVEVATQGEMPTGDTEQFGGSDFEEPSPRNVFHPPQPANVSTPAERKGGRQ